VPRQEDIRNTIWDDLDELSNDALLLYIWSWTNLKCGPSGVYPCPRRKILDGRLGDGEQLDGALKELRDADKVWYEGGFVWSVTRTKRLGWKNPQAEIGINKELAELDPDNPILAAYVDRYEGFPWGKGGEGRLSLSQGIGKGPSTHESNGSVGPVTHPIAKGRPTDAGKGNGKGKGRGKEGSTQSSTAHVGLAAGGAPAIREALPDVVAALGRISETRGFPFADESRVLAAMCAYPDADHVARASDMEDWLCGSDHGKRQTIKDLVQAYRNQLKSKQPAAANGKGQAAAALEDDEDYDEAVIQSG
jgi:hypothetical protein